MNDKKLLRLAHVMELTGLKKSTVYAWADQRRFPRPIKIAGSRASAWITDEVLEWIGARTREGIAARDRASTTSSAVAA